MKRTVYVVVLALALPAGLLAYENSPSQDIIIPEVVWAAAPGGGTWVTELQVSECLGTWGADVGVIFISKAGDARNMASLWISPGGGCSAKWANILATMQTIDSGFTYYGRSGILWLQTQDERHLISAVARTHNGGNGKTIPGLQWTDSNTANVGRDMVIMNVMSGPDVRTFASFFNATRPESNMACQMSLVDMNGAPYGASWGESFAPWEYKSFNVFAKAGLASGTHDNLRLLIHPIWCTASGAGSRGLFCFGSTANNETNATSALLAAQYQ